MTGNGGNKQKLKQRQKLSARQIQLMQMVMLPQTELSQRIKQELERNPALEEGSDEPGDYEDLPDGEGDVVESIDADDYTDVDEIPGSAYKHTARSEGASATEIPFADTPTLTEYLRRQLYMTDLDEEQRQIAAFVIGSLEDDGYLRQTVEGLADDLAIYQGIYCSTEEVGTVVRAIRALDPPGVGARDLRDCLLLQLERRAPETPAISLAKRLLTDHFDELSKRHYSALSEACDADDDQIRDAIRLIVSLNPTPGLDFGTRMEGNAQTVVPDFVVTESNGDLVVTLNNGDIPEVRVNRQFEDEMSAYTGDLRSLPREQRETGKFVKGKLDAARTFVDMIRQRRETLMSTMMCIVDMQREYFLSGDMSTLRPMILKDVADRIGYDISTISRVTSTKYVQTDFGTFPLRHFFSEGTMRNDGEEISTRHVRQILREIIDEEDKRRPLSDEALSRALDERGYDVARRTVAKYRDGMGIPVARLRKEF